MGLLASIVAYLSVVAAIVIGFIMSADALLSHSHRTTTDARPEITTAAKTDSLRSKNVAHPPKAAELRAIPQKSTAAEYRRKTGSSYTRTREPHKRIVHEARRYSPLRQERDVVPRQLGYAEEPRFGGNSWR